MELGPDDEMSENEESAKLIRVLEECVPWTGSSKILVRDWVKPSVRLLLRLYLTLIKRGV